MKNVFVLLLVGLMVISCKTTKEVEEVVEEERTAELRETAPRTPNRGPKRGGVEAEQLAAELGLSVEQEKLFLEVYEKTTEKMQKVRIEHRGERDVLLEAMKAVKAERMAELEKILTVDQMNQYYNMMKTRRGKIRGTPVQKKG